jgi:hypothetical protein
VFVAPSKGDALLFWDLKPDGQTGDKYSMHAGVLTLLCCDASCPALGMDW